MKQLLLPVTGTLLLFVGALMQAGCSADVVQKGQSSDLIHFSVASDSEWTEAGPLPTRGVNAPGHASVTQNLGAGGPDPFYLHALSRDNDEAEESPDTRGVSINSVDGQSISVTAFAFENWDCTLTPNFMVEEELSSPWATDRYWPNTGLKLQFFSHCPYRIEGWKRIIEAGYPKYNYGVPADAAGQSDVLVAWTGELGDKSKEDVKLDFKHALTRIKFTAAADFQPGTINSITLKGVYGAGVFSYGSHDWEELSNPTDFVNQINKEVTSAGGSLLTEELTFMMLPQVFAEDSQASVEISFTAAADGTEKILEFPLKCHEWGKGKVVNYRLSVSP